MATYQLRSLSLGEIVDGAIAIYRMHFGTLASIAIICQGVPAILNVYVDLGGGLLIHPTVWFTAVLLSWLGGIIAVGATVWAISEAYLGREPLVGDALRFAAGKMLRLFVAGIAKGILVGLAAVFFLIPGVIVMCGYSVVTQVVVLEDLPAATDALGRSWYLTKAHKWKALGLGVVVFLLIGLPLVIGGAIAAFVPALFVTLTVGSQILQLLLYPVMACVFTLFYYDLRVRKEAFDLEHLSQQIGLSREATSV